MRGPAIGFLGCEHGRGGGPYASRDTDSRGSGRRVLCVSDIDALTQARRRSQVQELAPRYGGKCDAPRARAREG